MAATAADPNYVPAHLALADVDISLGKLDEARHTLQAVLSKQPRNTQAKLRLGTVEETAGDLAAAREQYREVVQWEPRNVTALNGLAFTLAPDNPDEALKYAQSAVELAPEDPIAHDNLGWLYYRKGVYYTAVEHLKSSVAKDPNALHRYHLALAYAKLGNKQLAQENLDAALRLDPKVQASDPFPK
jgi:tetratricopeptide (TPR) repeat protein